MAQEFRSDSIPSGSTYSESGDEKRETVRVMIIGSREGILEQIRIFYNKGVAEVDAWSSLLPVPNSSDLMSILTRWRKGTNTKQSGE